MAQEIRTSELMSLALELAPGGQVTIISGQWPPQAGWGTSAYVSILTMQHRGEKKKQHKKLDQYGWKYGLSKDWLREVLKKNSVKNFTPLQAPGVLAHQ